RQERYLPFVSITLFYGATAYMFLHKIGLIPPLSVIMLASTSLIFILLVITFWFKISIHATAAWSFSGYLTALSITQPDMVFFVPLLLSFPMAGLVATSRLWLGYHSPREIWAGIALGYGYSFMTVFVFG
ncbi:MAG: hypothetical protein OEY56_10800, partial [Cyclobacteriaceae bacterium]|nr:hypothetical protein [Cyclobacteriaceae bacterium]